MEEDRLLELLIKDMESVISMTEKEELNRWLTISDENKLKAETIRQAWKATASLKSKIKIDLEKEYQSVQQKIKQKNSSSKIIRIWPVAAAIVILTGIWYFLSDSKLNRNEQFVGPLQNVILKDGSVIELAENSIFDFQVSDQDRVGKLTGKGFFHVKSATNPFSIKTNVGVITVVGTAFAIDALEQKTIVSVDEGSVRLSDDGNVSLEINPGEEGTLTYNDLSKRILQRPAGFWRLQPKTYDQAPFSDLIRDLEKFYHVSLLMENPDVANCKITFTLAYPELRELVTILETLLSIDISNATDTQFIIKGSGCL